MSMRPQAALALWNDIHPARDAEYEHWHSTEHVPERVWSPGFLRATRYGLGVGDGPKYFTLYELRTLDALGSPEYRDLVRHPTPWSASMRPAMSRFVRKPLVLSALSGVSTRGADGGLVVMRVVWSEPPMVAARLLAEFVDRVRDTLPDASRAGGGWVAEAGPQAIANIQDAPPGREAVVWVELETDAGESRLQARRDALVDQVDATMPAPTWLQADGYRLLTRVERSRAADSPRPQPRMDLMDRYHGDKR
jgi:hypothetical protein